MARGCNAKIPYVQNKRENNHNNQMSRRAVHSRSRNCASKRVHRTLKLPQDKEEWGWGVRNDTFGICYLRTASGGGQGSRVRVSIFGLSSRGADGSW